MEQILFLIAKSNKAVESGTYHQYLSCYYPDFLPNITWWGKWINYRKNLKEKISNSIKQDNILILKYNDLYVAVFDQYIKLKNSGERKYIGTEKKFIKFDQNNNPFIVSEEPLKILKNLTTTDKSPALIAAYLQLIQKTDQQVQIGAIKETINLWLKAWSDKDINSYAKCYSKSFRFGNISLDKWLKNKQQINKQYKFIKVTAEDIKINIKNNQSIVTFIQKYISDAYKAKGRKTLTLIQENNEWKIYREGWKKL